MYPRGDTQRGARSGPAGHLRGRNIRTRRAHHRDPQAPSGGGQAHRLRRGPLRDRGGEGAGEARPALPDRAPPLRGYRRRPPGRAAGGRHDRHRLLLAAGGRSAPRLLRLYYCCYCYSTAATTTTTTAAATTTTTSNDDDNDMIIMMILMIILILLSK